MRRVRPAVRVAEEVGPRLGRGQVLQRALPAQPARALAAQREPRGLRPSAECEPAHRTRSETPAAAHLGFEHAIEGRRAIEVRRAIKAGHAIEADRAIEAVVLNGNPA